MNWAWLVSEGLIDGDPVWYSSGEASAEAINHAIEVAYLAADPEQRKQLVDMAWESGTSMGGNKEYWYEDRSSEVQDLAAGYSGVRVEPDSEEAAKIAADYTDDETTRFNGLPGNPEIWIDTDTGKVYAVYFPENMDPPVPLRYHIPNEAVLATYFGDQPFAYDKEYTSAEMNSLGAVTFGDVSDIEDTTGDPWAGFTIKMERAKKAMPWLEDPKVFAIVAAAYLEGRTPEAYEFADTDWYINHNDAERAWMTTVAQDPATALQQLDDAKSKVREEFLALGLAVPDEAVIDHIAQQWRQGTWSLQDRDDQIRAATGAGEGVVIDPELATLIGDTDLGTATSMVDTVKNLYSMWLGTTYAPSEADIAKWAGIMRDDATGGEARLTTMLRAQRLALFPEYTDDTLTWSDISGPWKGMAYNVWGVEAQDDDAEFVNIVSQNDAVEAKKELRRIGLERGYEQVTTSAANSLARGMSTGVRGAV